MVGCNWKASLTNGNVQLRDQIEWDISNDFRSAQLFASTVRDRPIDLAISVLGVFTGVCSIALRRPESVTGF